MLRTTRYQKKNMDFFASVFLLVLIALPYDRTQVSVRIIDYMREFLAILR